MARQVMERWLSGRKHVPAKDAYPSKGIEGSNPSLSDPFSIAYMEILGQVKEKKLDDRIGQKSKSRSAF